MRRVSLLLPLAAALLVGAPLADEVRMSDGRVLVGPTVKRGKKLQVKTLDGVVVVLRKDVVGVRTDEQLRAELQSLATRSGNTLFGELQLARTARDWGLYDKMWERLDACLEQVVTGIPVHVIEAAASAQDVIIAIAAIEDVATGGVGGPVSAENYFVTAVALV